MDKMALKAGKSMDELHDFADRFLSSVCVTENWDRLMERGVDVLFQPGTHDYVAYDILWGAQNHPQLPVYYEPNGGHSQTPHVAAAKDEQNTRAFLWNHFFGGESLLKPPTSSHEVDKDKLSVSVRFDEGPQPKSGRIWWIYDRAPAGSAPFLHVQIPEDQWMDMERDRKDRRMDRHHTVKGWGFPNRFLQQSRAHGQRLQAVSFKPLYPSGTWPVSALMASVQQGKGLRSHESVIGRFP